jgi:hypothetical protein
MIEKSTEATSQEKSEPERPTQNFDIREHAYLSSLSFENIFEHVAPDLGAFQANFQKYDR